MNEDANSLVPEHSIPKQMLTLRPEHPIIVRAIQEIRCLRIRGPRFCVLANLVGVTWKDYKFLWSEPCVCPQTDKNTQVSQLPL